MDSQQPVVIEPASSPADAAVIWLHGLGADGHDFEAIVPQLDLPHHHAVRFIFPHAPVSPVTLNGGMAMRSWYDIRSLDLLNEVDVSGIEAASVIIADLVDQQIALGIDPARIILAGFSQGGLVALQCGLSLPHRLGGVMALSTYYPVEHLAPVSDLSGLKTAVQSEPVQADNHERLDKNYDLPILMMHGLHDSVVPYAIGQTSKETLQAQGYRVTWHEYPMEHQICGDQITQIARWLSSRLSS